jgi:glutathione S-transferase
MPAESRLPDHDATLRLYTFTLSHFSEKIRWTLSAAGVAFEEVPWTPFFHVLRARRRGKATTVPVLETREGPVQDSTRILLWLEKHRTPFPFIPQEPAAREAALEVEARFDKVGEHVVRYAYSVALDDAESVIRYWTTDASALQARIIRRFFPAMRWIFRRKLRMSPTNVQTSRATIEAGLAWIESRTTSPTQRLVGDRLTIADFGAAALLAPLVCPDEHPIYGSSRYRAAIAPLVGQWQDRPAFAWVRAMYRDHRGDWGPRARAVRQWVDRA